MEEDDVKWILLDSNTVRIDSRYTISLYSYTLIRFECVTVFVGEVKNGQISGFHNWIQFYFEEKAGNVDYRGYIKPRSRKSTAQTNDDDPLLTLQFRWNGVEKFVGTSFIGKECFVLL